MDFLVTHVTHVVVLPLDQLYLKGSGYNNEVRSFACGFEPESIRLSVDLTFSICGQRDSLSVL